MFAVASPGTLTRRDLAELLAEARSRTVLLVSPLSAEDMLVRPHEAVRTVMEELDAIVRFENRWLAGGSDDAYPASRSYDQWFDRMIDVRERALDLSPPVEHTRLVLEHEYQRGETILETLQLLGERYRAPRRTALPLGRRLADPGAMTRFPGGTVELADSSLDVAPFWIDVLPVTNGEYATFMAAGGYMDSRLWSDAGWEWARASDAQMPAVWTWEDGAWWSRWMDRMAPLDLTCPVGPVSWYEAEAFARFVGKRLPTGVEWEVAATWDPESQARRGYPWGNMAPSPHVANLDQLAFGPAAVGAFPGNLSPLGCYGVIGDLWEWTSSADQDDCKVLRGGSWATRPGAIGPAVRRAAHPASRHCFSGFRCAHDAVRR